ncbi:uncharacterized protein PHACADRAFT_258014 [Phanerochaete carnosa HHB-10118-sp]|uniref:Uncharacterized protein n=1 Tax=Phanerochaete carnosa (strain HHB-10118-sp) TaxID=650164 RepID=K5W564_PHACS|nr:uncharacterized protein PHACADRAFT_258014 [Phanerochaete carnosa HHB-10118-sp]EKM54270.1 hypothetical protein PHACADRAFT_258014 [Phanerochaete carnosa HHB-10118-sp]
MAAAVASRLAPPELHAKPGALAPSDLAMSRRRQIQAPISTTPQDVLQPDAHNEHDPHRLPDFDEMGLAAPPHPILYLPPLLSKLPEGYSHYHEPSGRFKPLSTETHLPDIDSVSLSLHKALHKFHPVTDEYAETPYEEAFNWSELELPENAEREWYAVSFRSKRKEGSDGGPLYEADKQAHEEAVRNGGLILYWYGIPHPKTGLNLATCIWQSRAHAIAAHSGPHHISAMRLAAASYERYELRRYRISKVKGERALSVEPYDGGDVGW